MASLEPTTIEFEAMRLLGGSRRLEAFSVGDRFGPDLAYLAGLLDAGELDPQIGRRGPWAEAPEAAEALLARRVQGKAVLDLDGRRS